MTLRALDASCPNLLVDCPIGPARGDNRSGERGAVARHRRTVPGAAGRRENRSPSWSWNGSTTFDGSNLASRRAHGKDLVLFDGFRVDLDSGQIVPEGQGGDLRFQTDAETGPRLAVVGNAKLYTLTRAPVTSSAASARPSSGRTVVPGDFRGQYRLFANGQWSGALTWTSIRTGAVTGQFRSDLNGTAYQVNGQVAPEVPHKSHFRIKYPRTQQDFEGYLWTEGKGHWPAR